MYTLFRRYFLHKKYGDYTHNQLSSLYYCLINLLAADLKGSIFAQIFGDKNKTARVEIEIWQA